MQEKKCAIPTNIITGFLGVGKTTAIRSLLETKQSAEKWAVLVNEFGEVGLDASLLASRGTPSGDTDKVFIREVPGGCMCCASGLPMQVALNQLISHSKPDRLIIEPTGLGHPQEVLNALMQESYQGVLELQATLTLIDARKVANARYADHETFKQQLQIADIIIANKSDLYSTDDFANLQHYLHQLELNNVPLHKATQGRIESGWLAAINHIAAKNIPSREHTHHRQDHFVETSVLKQGPLEFPDAGYIRKDNASDDYKSSGWIFESHLIFDRTKLLALFTGLNVERLKAIFITPQGVMSFNQVDGVLSYSAVTETMDSRIEVIGQKESDWSSLEADLLDSLHIIPITNNP